MWAIGGGGVFRAFAKALEAVDLDPNNAQAHAYLAEVYADMGNCVMMVTHSRDAALKADRIIDINS